MHEARNIELAARLLDVVNEPELAAVVGGLVADTARATGRHLGAADGRALVAELVRTAERTLPTLIVALGARRAPAPASAAETAARTYGLELEGMSAEDRDFEIARRFVDFAETATVRATR